MTFKNTPESSPGKSLLHQEFRRPLADKEVACNQVLTRSLIARSNHQLAKKRLIMDFYGFQVGI